MNDKRQLDFIGKRILAFIVSSVLLSMTIAAFITKGLTLGVDFTGGIVTEIHYPQSVDLDKMRGGLTEHGFPDTNVQHFGSSQDVLLRLKPVESTNQDELNKQILLAANTTQAQPGEFRRVEFIGPQVGEDLMNDGGLALFFALVGVMIFVSIRFEWKFAIGAVLALIHDVLIILGAFAMFGWEFDMNVLAAVLATIGYSMNDTIVVYDRIREALRSRRIGSVNEITNAALNETLIRTLLTSTTVFLTVIALLIFGGKGLHGFSVAMMIGVMVGTYSSIYVASSLTLALGLRKEDLLPPDRDQSIDRLP
jgi:preprotein translocase subunit SecF